MRIWRKGKGMEVVKIEEEDAFYRQMCYFLSCVEKGEKPTLITPAESYEVIKMVDALHESVRTHQAITLDDYVPFDFKK